MTLTDPRDALAEQSSFIGYLMGVAGLARLVRTLTQDSGAENQCNSEEFVHLLLGIAALGDRIERLVEPPAIPPAADLVREPTLRWLR